MDGWMETEKDHFVYEDGDDSLLLDSDFVGLDNGKSDVGLGLHCLLDVLVDQHLETAQRVCVYACMYRVSVCQCESGTCECNRDEDYWDLGVATLNGVDKVQSFERIFEVHLKTKGQ